ncbi:MAG: oxygen-independent coproporphyrinogen III oxidase [Candidatus Latescibacteria bacterium]|nr:oxygen-independent coproporphyrinogen III oxidase [Candidatus Latescibacterota bacterium]
MDRVQVDADLLRRYDRPGPRYTSYPTAVEFHDGFTPQAYAGRLRQIQADETISLYIHLPFCQHRCTFCGCHVVATTKKEIADRYLDYLEEEMKLVRSQLTQRPRVVQYHWGGGTPTYFSPEQLQRLHRSVNAHFDLQAEAEQAVEVDPRVTTPEHIEVLADLGFNRLSLGVQDLSPQVQEAIGRNQDETQTRRLFELCRERDFASINIDLIYGLPRQTSDGFGRTLETVLDLRPDRVALYSYAHVPWVKGHQKKIDTDLLPAPQDKFALFAQGLGAFLEGGYQQIGMDHFALPQDELGRARRQRRLHRNFMGYTVQRAPHMIGLGISSIGDTGGAYVQNCKKLSTYYAALDQGELPVEKGYVLSPDDALRRWVITELMCNAHLDWKNVEDRFGVSYSDYFARELEELATGPAVDDFVRIDPGTLEVTPLGQLFIRNICMIFDSYLQQKKSAAPIFSRTV